MCGFINQKFGLRASLVFILVVMLLPMVFFARINLDQGMTDAAEYALKESLLLGEEHVEIVHDEEGGLVVADQSPLEKNV